MRFLKLIRLASSSLAIPDLGGVRLDARSSSNAIPVYIGAFDAYVASDPSLAVHISGLFGDGRDGPVHYTSDTTLTADVRASTIVVDPGVTVHQAGFLQTATISILNNGTISDAGSDVTNTTRSPVCTAGVGPGKGLAAGFSGAGSDSFTGSSSPTYDPVSARGASGGDGGGSGHGTGGTNVTGFWIYNPRVQHPFTTNNPVSLVLADFVTFSSTLITIGCGGGGGGGTGAGGGGGGGGIVRLKAPQIINNGTITARGGNGEAGTGTNANGGGGGGGGRIIIYGKLLVTGTLDVSGGRGGAATGTGTAGQPGQNGTIHLFGA